MLDMLLFVCDGVLACLRDDFIEAATSALLEDLDLEAGFLRFEDSPFPESEAADEA